MSYQGCARKFDITAYIARQFAVTSENYKI